MNRNYKEIVNQMIKAYSHRVAKSTEFGRIMDTRSLLKGLNGLALAAWAASDIDATTEINNMLLDIEKGGNIEPYNLEDA
ncbi:DUF4754 family protein [Escherichia coli]|uniref:DUF4754 family protein n=1 Tax=Escherichia coli TaxID=562 RepID=UPI000BE30065|nr:DUF4754 family protein [Escherichia coli]EGO4195202.1 DUF4754 domain-containing protein [Escherichia coli]EKY5035128.1 DUF4754 family protein [Escherichia coli]DAY48758.1 MAG TPA: protein of unknown function (DUF4754) [Caudoviricetes sp.]HAX2330243.1 DUF4754 domain-containing protein [Escherichia coli]